uniref:Uncharacterized protein n=1 Tax=Tanacetum cinerariifolium TaxID=118510 RepID=A0A699HU99_TANCI|nr:hypothetical protein [Tanacetum cinerariifolium]
MYEEPASSDDISLCYGKPDEKNFEPDSTCTYIITYADVLIGKCYVMMFKELTTKKAKGFIFQYIIARMMFDLIKEGDQWISIDGHEAVTVKDEDVLMKVAANIHKDLKLPKIYND